MRARKEDPRVFDKDGVTLLKMGDWVRKIPPEYLDLEQKVAAMDKSGIDVTLLTSNDPGPEWFGADGPAVAQLLNDGVRDIVRKYRGRFAGLCVLPLQDPGSAERELDRCVKSLGMKGILLYSNLAGQWPDEPRFRWLFARAQELDVPIVLHPALPTTLAQTKGHDLTGLLGNMFENTISLARIVAAGIFDEFPNSNSSARIWVELCPISPAGSIIRSSSSSAAIRISNANPVIICAASIWTSCLPFPRRSASRWISRESIDCCTPATIPGCSPTS